MKNFGCKEGQCFVQQCPSGPIGIKWLERGVAVFVALGTTLPAAPVAFGFLCVEYYQILHSKPVTWEESTGCTVQGFLRHLLYIQTEAKKSRHSRSGNVGLQSSGQSFLSKINEVWRCWLCLFTWPQNQLAEACQFNITPLPYSGMIPTGRKSGRLCPGLVFLFIKNSLTTHLEHSISNITSFLFILQAWRRQDRGSAL